MLAFTPTMTLHGRYRLDERVGAGGMAEVWRGTDLVLGRAVAIKLLDGALADDPELRAGARREAQAAAKLTHPHITAVHDYAELATPDGRVIPYIVQELLSGQTLAQRMHGGPVPWPEAATIAGQIAAALAVAHSQGIVHQDIKPGNIMLTPTGVKVLDFGIAALHHDSPGWIVGTPAYAAPERAHKARPEPSADIFSLGVVTYEMVSGHRPWPIDSWEQAALGRPAPAPLPVEVPAEVLAALSPAPAQRPTAAQLVAALGPAGADTRPGIMPVAPPAIMSPTLVARPDAFVAGSARVPDHPTQVYEEAPLPPRRSSLRPVLAVVVLLMAFGLVLLAAALLQSNGGGNAEAQPPATSSVPSAPTVASPTPTPSATPTASADAVRALLVQLRNAVDSGEQAGEIRSNRADDFRSRISELSRLWNDGRTGEVVNKAKDLKQRIADRERNGDVSASAAQNLFSLLDQLIAQVSR
jgi:serine/threonine-protein kinase